MDFNIAIEHQLVFIAESGPNYAYIQCVEINITDDSCVEEDEEFTVHLTTDDDSVKFSTSYATVVIFDDDGT